MSFSIRRVDADQLPVLRRLAEETFRDAWQAQNDPVHFEAYCRAHFTPERLAAEMLTPGTEFYFGQRGERPIAYLKLNIGRLPAASSVGQAALWSGLPVHIERIYVARPWQGEGIGAALLAFAEERARQCGASWLWLSVWQEALQAIRFYQKNGFSVFGTEIFWVGDDPQPDWLMRRKVGALEVRE